MKETSTQVSTGLGSVHPGPHVTSRQVPRKPPCPQSPPCLRRVTTVPAASGTARPRPFPNLPQTDSHSAHTHRLPSRSRAARPRRAVPAGRPSAGFVRPVARGHGLLPSVLRASQYGLPGARAGCPSGENTPRRGAARLGFDTTAYLPPPTAAAGRRARSALSPAPGLFHGPFQPRWGSGGRGQGSQHRSAIWGLVQASLFCRLLLRACCPPGTCSCLRPASCRVAFSHPFTALRSFCLYVAWLGRASETRVPAPTHAHVRTRHVRTASPSSAVFPSPEGVF